MIYGKAVVKDNAIIKGDSYIGDDAIVSGNARIEDSFVQGPVKILGSAMVKDANIYNHAVIKDNAIVHHAYIAEKAVIFGRALILRSNITNTTQVSGYVSDSTILGKSKIFGRVINSHLKDQVVEQHDCIKNGGLDC